MRNIFWNVPFDVFILIVSHQEYTSLIVLCLNIPDFVKLKFKTELLGIKCVFKLQDLKNAWSQIKQI